MWSYFLKNVFLSCQLDNLYLKMLVDTILFPFKMGAKSTTLTGLSGTGDVMLTCFVSLSRNRTVGVRLGSGEKLDDILSSMNQVQKIELLYHFLALSVLSS